MEIVSSLWYADGNVYRRRGDGYVAVTTLGDGHTVHRGTLPPGAIEFKHIDDYEALEKQVDVLNDEVIEAQNSLASPASRLDFAADVVDEYFGAGSLSDDLVTADDLRYKAAEIRSRDQIRENRVGNALMKLSHKYTDTEIREILQAAETSD